MKKKVVGCILTAMMITGMFTAAEIAKVRVEMVRIPVRETRW